MEKICQRHFIAAQIFLLLQNLLVRIQFCYEICDELLALFLVWFTESLIPVASQYFVVV